MIVLQDHTLQNYLGRFCQADTPIPLVILIYDHTNVTLITCDTPHNVRIDSILD
jgi:hypothetical protein